jgi:hypothetical protein
MSRVTSKGTSKTNSREEVPMMPKESKGNVKMKKSRAAMLRDKAMDTFKNNNS